jgi:hypothetical protein
MPGSSDREAGAGAAAGSELPLPGRRPTHATGKSVRDAVNTAMWWVPLLCAR